MNRKHKSRIWEIIEILLALAVTVSGAVLVWDWSAYEILFPVAFGTAAVLFIIRAIRTVEEDHRGRIFSGIFYIVGAVIMVALMTGSILTIWGGNL